MGVAVDESVLEDHIREDRDQVGSYLLRVDAATLDLGTVVDLAAADELHDDEPL